MEDLEYYWGTDAMEFDIEYFQSLNLSFGSGDYENDSSDPCDAIFVCATQPCDGILSQGFLRVFMPIFYSAIFLLGLVGNGMVVGVLMRNIRTLAVTETYILHLAVADILLASGMPFWAVEEARGWVFGTVACKLFGALYNINFYSSIYLLGCISFDRYLSIVHAVQMYKKRRPWRVYLSCAVVWFVCLLLAIPDFIYLKVIKNNGSTQCTHAYGAGHSKVWIVAMRCIYHITGFLLPLTVMCYCYLNIIRTLNQSHNIQRRKERRAIKVIAVVVGAFFLCWTPYNVVMFLETLHRLGAISRDCEMEAQMDTSYSLTSCLGNLHCCLNPFLYAFVGVKFRRHLLVILRDGGCVSREFVKRFSRPSRRQSVISVSESGDTSYSGF